MAISKKAQTIIKIIAIILVVVIGMGIAVVSVGLLFMSPMTLFLALGNTAINTAEKNNSDADVIEAKHYRDTYVYAYNLVPILSEELTVDIKAYDDTIFATNDVKFYSIPGVSTNDFVVEHYFDAESSSGSISVSIKKRSDYSQFPIDNWNISKAEFYWYDEEKRYTITDPKTYGKDIVAEIAFSPEHEPLIEDMRRSMPVNPSSIKEIRNYDKNTTLKLRLYFEDYKNLAWDGDIYLSGEYYYVGYYNQETFYEYVRLPNAVSAQLDEYLKNR